MYSFKRKGVAGSVKALKKNQVLRGIKEVVTSEQDSTQLTFQFVQRNQRDMKRKYIKV